jgi:hypothetical protein
LTCPLSGFPLPNTRRPSMRRISCWKEDKGSAPRVCVITDEDNCISTGQSPPEGYFRITRAGLVRSARTSFSRNQGSARISAASSPTPSSRPSPPVRRTAACNRPPRDGGRAAGEGSEITGVEREL